MGAHATINPLRENLKERIWEETQNNGAGHIVCLFPSFFHCGTFFDLFFCLKNSLKNNVQPNPIRSSVLVHQ